MSIHARIHEIQTSYKRAGNRQSRHIKIQPWDRIDPSTMSVLEYIFSASDVLVRYFGMSEFDDIFGVVGKAQKDTAVDDQKFMEQYPILSALLTKTPTIEGKRRQTATLTIVCEDGMAKAGVRDRDRDVSLWVSAPTVLGTFTALEEALTARPVAWRRLSEHAWKGRVR